MSSENYLYEAKPTYQDFIFRPGGMERTSCDGTNRRPNWCAGLGAGLTGSLQR